MIHNSFFKNEGPFPLQKIIDICDCRKNFILDLKVKIYGISDLFSAGKNDVTFFNSLKYKNKASSCNATACITSENLMKHLPNNCSKIIVDNVLLSVAKVSKLFYPSADLDFLDETLCYSDELEKKYSKVKFGKNVLVGKNVEIGEYTTIGSNSIIEHDVKIGQNCNIGSFVVIKNSILENEVVLKDGAKIGVKGFGFIPNKGENFRIPHSGNVILKKGVEIGSGCTIDRGSITNTVIGENTYIDNQVQIAHNVKIGNNCIIAGQAGIAGSTELGNNVAIGGKAAISGHLKIGNNVKVGGKSGVLRDIPDNMKVMGYPSIEFRKFVKKWKLDD